MSSAQYLGDGAYLTTCNDNTLVITANHHHPSIATDVVAIDRYAEDHLRIILNKRRIDRENAAKEVTKC